tara:strand:- start:208 stop:471 length:264 start_codon:yes stop_codon:yes gene_type:complete
MKTIIILVIITFGALYFSSQLRSNGNKYAILYVSWASSLLFFNIFMAFFLYVFTHRVKNNEGEIGLKGDIGPRGYEGKSDLCKFKCA